MAGIYLHIPFCKRKCFYCDFYSVATLGRIDGFISAMIKELELRHHYIENEIVETIYFGGGTPSVLSPAQISFIINKLKLFFRIVPAPEITLEMNPDDMEEAYLTALFETGVNRLSVGVQSFSDSGLQWMNRLHTARQSHECISLARNAGFENISLDLIFGYPLLDDASWIKEIDTALSLGITHLSAYQLSIEPNTVFQLWQKKGKISLSDDEQVARQYDLLSKIAVQNGFQHYEISNFALPGFHSKHNSAYWKGKNYLGLGPSAHSFNGHSRQWNVANLKKYIEALEKSELAFELELLDEKTRFNEFIMTRLRTSEGILKNEILQLFGAGYTEYLESEMPELIESGRVIASDSGWVIHPSAYIFADSIIASLMKE